MVSIFSTKTVFLDVLKMKLKTRVARLVVVGSHVVLAGFGGIQKFRIQYSELKTNTRLDITPARRVISPSAFTWRKLTPAKRATRLGGVPHFSLESDQEKKRDCMERLVTPPRRGISPSRGPPRLCEQALRSCWYKRNIIS